LFVPLHYPPHTHNSHFYKLTTFAIVKLFFLYDLLTLKTLYNVRSSCCCTTPLSHTQRANRKRKKENTRTNIEQTQKETKKEIKKKNTRDIETNTKRNIQRKNQKKGKKKGRKQESEEKMVSEK
jgi:hypothetical protein